jgi:hypothetical protein
LTPVSAGSSDPLGIAGTALVAGAGAVVALEAGAALGAGDAGAVVAALLTIGRTPVKRAALNAAAVTRWLMFTYEFLFLAVDARKRRALV